MKEPKPPIHKAAEVEIDMDGASFHLGNCTIQDAHWFGELCTLFADPHHTTELAVFRSGRLFIGRDPRNGRLLMHSSDGTQHRGN